MAAWNIRNLCDRPGNIRPKESIALVACEVCKYNIEIAALSGVRLANFGNLFKERGAYTFIWQGKPSTDKRESGVGFTIDKNLKLSEASVGYSESKTLLTMMLAQKCHLHIVRGIQCCIDKCHNRFSRKDKAIVLGDFNAWVGSYLQTWPGILGHHVIGEVKSNGHLLISFCTELDNH